MHTSVQSSIVHNMQKVGKKTSKCPSIEWINQRLGIYTMEYYSALHFLNSSKDNGLFKAKTITMYCGPISCHYQNIWHQ